jgi:O-antigen ligase
MAADGDVLPKVLVTRGVVLLLALLLLARALVRGSLTLRRTPLDLPVLALVGSAVLSTLLSVNPTLSLFGAYTRYEGLITVATYAALFWLSAQCLTRPSQARWLLRAMLAGAAVECAIACSQALAASVSGDLSAFGESSTTFSGVARAIGTMANANNLAIWLAMLIPVGAYEAINAGALWGRILATACTLLMVVTLIVTFGRSAWIGAALGVVLTLALSLRAVTMRKKLITGAAGIVIAGGVFVGIGTLTQRLGVPVIGPAYERLVSIASPTAGSGGVRLHLYADTVRLVTQRPLVGYGPDTFGLVSPSRSTGDWTPGIVVDKAHSDILQVAATQGILGVGANLWLLGSAAVMLAKNRARPGVPAVAGAVLAYQVAIMLNFAWFPVTAPFWIILGVGVTLSESTRDVERMIRIRPMVRGTGVALGAAACVLALVMLSVRPALANYHYGQALGDWSARQRAPALQQIAAARADDSAQSEYAAFQGDVEADLAGERPGPDADLVAARHSYEEALAAGEMYPSVPIRLAYVDVALGDRGGALAAARAASDLDPYGPAVKLIAELGG